YSSLAELINQNASNNPKLDLDQISSSIEAHASSTIIDENDSRQETLDNNIYLLYEINEDAAHKLAMKFLDTIDLSATAIANIIEKSGTTNDFQQILLDDIQNNRPSRIFRELMDAANSQSWVNISEDKEEQKKIRGYRPHPALLELWKRDDVNLEDLFKAHELIFNNQSKPLDAYDFMDIMSSQFQYDSPNSHGFLQEWLDLLDQQRNGNLRSLKKLQDRSKELLNHWGG
ncbi:MAG: hypothetical protein LW817_08745, partial [Candidatus Caenarcaniphilales bacterium]|nr:hypothetical protein [Candidatus Caenarcaniphilales bacterium]